MGTAYIHQEDGKRWVRITQGSEVWDEPATDFEYVIDLIRNLSYYRRKADGAAYSDREV